MTKQAFRYTHYDLKAQPAGTVVEVTLSCINNVRLLDGRNFKLFQTLKPHKFLGGLAKISPTRLVVPQGGHWHLVVDMDGLPALANSSVKTIVPGHLTSARQMQATMPVDRAFLADTAARALGDINADTNGAERIMENMADAPDDIEDIRRELDTYKRLANTDALTGLNNRRAFDMQMKAIFSTADNLEQTALVIGDIDHFKSFNDTYGHPVGDLVLRSVARVLIDNLRGNTFVARTGGEEFGFIIRDAGRSTAMQIADRVCTAVEKATISDPGTKQVYGPVTISMGLCMAVESNGPEMLYQKVDTALYASKRNGRNQCNAYHESMEGNSVQYATG
ncbi:DUF1883 domain-containing protein [Rhizobium sp. L1K21]|uniref:DUF1883 domain-containing protein n=1 Tax=Rhizobium sp. L1K21 TaxID=2954933 RepID=UPI0020927810|nr:DUF1883 domain-containing protein [Rhizobium sp. L1K21]MCO6186359.1 DUF1883 domain-containing protein [Rhizobium sp. L1K21]